jgi:hypothetical protein
VRLRDSILYCQDCGSEKVYDSETLSATRGTPEPCWKCHKAIRLPYRLKLAKGIVMLNYDTKLFAHHLDDQKLYDFSKAVAEVTQHPKDHAIWGLKNVSDERWSFVTQSDPTPREIEPGRSVTLATGIKIYFGRTQREIRI